MPILHKVRQGVDSLRSLALEYLGDQGDWYRLASLNGLPPSAASNLDGVAEVIIPIDAGPAGGKDPYLVDFAATGRRALALGDNGDLFALGGKANVRAALARALTTDTRAMLPHPEYGVELARFIGRGADGLRLLFLKEEVRRVILRDPRVQAITSLEVVQRPGERRAQILGRIELVGGDSIDLVEDRPL